MPEVIAINKYLCPACGAQAVWTPSKKALICPYCSTESSAELQGDGTLVGESDLAEALRALPDEKRGWAAVKKAVKCQSCQAISVFDEKRIAQACDFCGSPALMNMDDVQSPIRPGSQLPFQIAESTVRESIRQWYGSHFWARSDVGDKALTDTLHGIYLPYWTFDAQVECPWEAEAGYHYYTTDDKGNREQHTRWEYASGHVSQFHDDLLVPASKGVHSSLLTELEPFPTTTALLPYDPGYLTGWVVEQYQIDLLEAAQNSRDRMTEIVRQECSHQVPGDTQRGLRIAPTFKAQTFKHTLLPVWLLTYTYGSKTYQVAVNGATGKIAGEYPLSWVKITLTAILGLILLAIVMQYSK